MSATAQHTGRLYHIDGLRGFAAFVVLLWHATVVFFPAIAFGKLTSVSQPFEINLSKSPLTFFISGTFAVACFFVISGYVLTISYLRHGDIAKLTDTAIARFPRLFLPAAFSTMLMFALLWFDSSKSVPGLLAATGTSELIASNPLNLTANSRSLINNIFWLPWFELPDPRRFYSGVLWTMSIELWCSLIVMGLAVLVRGRRAAAILVLAIALVFIHIAHGYGIYMATFFVGTAIAVIDPKPVSGLPAKMLLVLLLLIGIWAAGYTGIGWTKPLSKLHFTSKSFDYGIFVKSVGAILIFVCVLYLDILARLLSSSPFRFLGRISFSLYLCHVLVIVLAGLLVFAVLGTGTPLNVRCLTAFIVAIAASLASSVVVMRFIDEPSIWVSRYIARVALRHQAKPETALQHK